MDSYASLHKEFTQITESTIPDPKQLSEISKHIIHALNQGIIRIAEPKQENWICHSWIKEAILAFFSTQKNQLMTTEQCNYFDKVPLKYTNYTESGFIKDRVRIVPPAHIRTGSYLAPGCVAMPCYVNIGAYIDENTMLDTWSTIGSCAQIGKKVHISGGAGIGGVLEPLQNTPTIIEDHAFIGARSEIVEGVLIKEHAVISMGVFISQSTPIYDRTTHQTSYGTVPAGAVVIPGQLPSTCGRYSKSAAIITKYKDERTTKKTQITELLREVVK